jgi:hypothetical protein
MCDKDLEKPDTKKLAESVFLVEALDNKFSGLVAAHDEAFAYLFKRVGQLEADNLALQSSLLLLTVILANYDQRMKEHINKGITATMSDLIPADDPYRLRIHLQNLINVISEDPSPQSRTERILKIVKSSVSPPKDE